MTVSVEWEVKATEFANCNCSYGCPCQFNALPTHGDCKYVAAFQIEQGHFGGVKLDGLRAVTMGIWPGAIHEGKGTMRVVIDERADPRQRDALAKILTGQETEDMATMWWVFGAMSPTKLPPVYAKIELEVDVDKPHRAIGGPRSGLVEGRADPQSRHWRGAPRSDRLPAELRIPARRDRERYVAGNRAARDRPQGQLGAVRPPPSQSQRALELGGPPSHAQRSPAP